MKTISNYFHKVLAMGFYLFPSLKGAGMLGVLLSVAIGVLVISVAIPVVWPLIANSGTAIAALTQTDSGTTIIQNLWVIILPIAAIAIMGGVIFFIYRKAKFG